MLMTTFLIAVCIGVVLFNVIGPIWYSYQND